MTVEDTILIIIGGSVPVVIIIVCFLILFKSKVDWSLKGNLKGLVTWVTWPFKFIWPDTKTIKKKMTNGRPNL